jgi:hypothetical protein
MGKKNHPAKLSPALEDELRDRLEELLDERDDVADKRRRLSRHLGGHLKVLDESVGLVRRQLKGQELDQLEIPGSEKPEPARDPLVSEILRIAGGLPAKGAAPAGEPEPLVLRGREEQGELVANVIGGTYRITRNDGTHPGWTAKWDPASGRGKLLAVAKPLEECKEAVRTHHLDRAGSDMMGEG